MDPSSGDIQKPAVSSPKALDGGWGWVVVLGSFIAYFIADGWSYSFGIIFPALIRHFGDGKGKTAVIGALLYGIPMVISPFVCALTTVYGCRPVAMAGGVITGISFILSAFATSVDYLCLSTGILASLGLCMTYVPSLVAVTIYFEKRRGLATGLAVTGSGLGAFAFPPMLEYLLVQYSWRGALLLLGAICFNIVAAGSVFRPLPVEKEPIQVCSQDHKTHFKRTTGNILMPRLHKQSPILRNRSQSLNVLHKENKTESVCWTLSPTLEESNNGATEDERLIKQQKPQTLSATSSPDLYFENTKDDFSNNKKCNIIWSETKLVMLSMLDKSLLLNWNYLLYCASHFILFMWIGIPYVYLVDKSMLLGIADNKAAMLLSIIGISRTVGQLILGILDDMPKVNTMILFASCVITAGLVTLLVPIYTNYISLIVYAVVFGFSVSATYTLEMICIVKLVGINRSTSAFGLMQLVMGIATLLGTPISGWLFDATGHYNPSFYIAGSLIITSGVMLLPLVWTMKPQTTTSSPPDPSPI